MEGVLLMRATLLWMLLGLGGGVVLVCCLAALLAYRSHIEVYRAGKDPDDDCSSP